MAKPESWIRLISYPCRQFTANEVAQIIVALSKIYKRKVSDGAEPRLVGKVVKDENGTRVVDVDAVDDVLALLQS